MEPYAEVVASYTSFAEEAGDSPCFVEWSLGVAGDPEVQRLIRTLPPVKQQPNLVFAAARWHGTPAPGPYAGLRATLLERWPEVRETILARSTQTNEVGRLATLLPAFATLGDRLHLIEVGASAGLCLYPDTYRHEWVQYDDPTVMHHVGDGPVLTCRVSGPVPFPERMPRVLSRAGIDLNPLDVTDADEMAWLANLVWPEQDARRARLAAAIDVARRDPPNLTRGNLLDALPRLLDRAPDEGSGEKAVTVVFHSAVIAYLEEPDRRRFAALMAGLVAEGRCHWVSNEGPNVLPGVTSTGPAPTRPGFVLGIDGRSVAFTHGHGSTLRWHEPATLDARTVGS
ncbi:DUF2332 domain-containing protein [Nocardioides sp. Root151]|uniref:DUF2332 domain-containing protein n=1 Tax=Nocardioides sp. Root151 TaxID=1736475 RepID=UPI000702BDBB|nr:DUF2332 domain-containing protein [Nocardioides sp. Root151]KQZ76055.1 hypothetical protein ASD66_07145 [Nocardioides sp. Root151]